MTVCVVVIHFIMFKSGILSGSPSAEMPETVCVIIIIIIILYTYIVCQTIKLSLMHWMLTGMFLKHV